MPVMTRVEYKGFTIIKGYIRSVEYYWITKNFKGLGISIYDLGEKVKKRTAQYDLHIGNFETLEKAKLAIDKGFDYEQNG